MTNKKVYNEKSMNPRIIHPKKAKKMSDKKCRAITLKGRRCKRKWSSGGTNGRALCQQHYNLRLKKQGVVIK